jgi:hypothetical protein
MLTKADLIFDLTLFTICLVTLNPHLTSNIIYTWLLISLLAAIVTHLISIYWKQLGRGFRKFSESILRHSPLNLV